MNDTVKMSIHLEIAAQKIVHQVMISNDEIEKQLEEGIRKAFERFDFEDAVEQATTAAIKEQIRHSSNWDRLAQLARQKADQIVQDHIDKHMQKLKDSL